MDWRNATCQDRQERGREQLRTHPPRSLPGAPRQARRASGLQPDPPQSALSPTGLARHRGGRQGTGREDARVLPACDGAAHRQAHARQSCRQEGRALSRVARYLQGGTGGGFPNTAGDIPAGGIRPLLVVLREVAARVGKTPAQVRFELDHLKGAIPIPGASSVLQVQENAGALGWRLSHEDVALLDAAADSLPFEFRGCGFQTASSKFVGYGFEEWRLD